MSRVTLPQQQTLSLRAALAIVLSVFLAVSFALYFVDGQAGHATSVLAAEDNDADDAGDGGVGDVEEVAVLAPLSTIPLSLGRDPFEPVRPEPPPATPAAATSDNGDGNGTDSSGDPDSGNTGDTGDTGDAVDTSTGTTIRLVEVRSDSAVVEVAGTSHDVMVGEVFAEEYRVLRVLGECAEIQRGDQVLPVLCVGEAISK